MSSNTTFRLLPLRGYPPDSWDQDSPAKSPHASPSQLRVGRIPEFAHHECVVARLGDLLGRLRPTRARRAGRLTQYQSTALDGRLLGNRFGGAGLDLLALGGAQLP